ncbi:MAG: hypothetical protein JXQ65_15330 [Candidatus Marinimicrobia bacterium]|nr:hypothetical protein [Candidatus Neomarinimicrobiota bacterium]
MDRIIKNIENTGFFRAGGRVIIKNIIKEKAINYSKPVPVGGETNFAHSNKKEVEDSHKIEPIIENDEIVGVIHHCICGRSTEIRFDY